LQIWTKIGMTVWFSGVAIMFIYALLSFIILKTKMRETIHLKTNIYEAKNIKSPFVLGFWKPKIYIPIGLSEKEISYIILHEQTHIRRLDHIIKLVSYFILSLHWFNPLVWVAFRFMSVDMEMSCDERVLKHKGIEIKKDYSILLLSLATEQHFVGGSPLAFGEGDTESRIKNILNYKKPAIWMVISAVIIVLAMTVGFAADPITKYIPQDTLNQLTDSISYTNGQISFVVPSSYANVEDFFIWILGHWEENGVKKKDFLFADESGNRTWQAGKTYSISTDGFNYKELNMSVSFIVGDNGQPVVHEINLLATLGIGDKDD